MNLFKKFKVLIGESDKNFETWFGKSKLHSDGKPIKFYHGSGSDIHSFSHDHIGKGTDALGSGFYFTSNPEHANHYANNKETGGAVYPVHLKIVKPIDKNSTKSLTHSQVKNLITSAPDHHEKLNNFGDVSHEGYHKVLKAATDQYADIPVHRAFLMLHNDFYGNHHSDYLKNFTKHTGHDGIIEKNPDGHAVVVAFHPHQIKSAIGNRGSYSTKINKIDEECKLQLSKRVK